MSDVVQLGDNPIVVGCNYHTTWQRHKAMRFVLGEVKGNRALMYTRNTMNRFYTDVTSLIFIHSKANRKKARNILKNNPNKQCQHSYLHPKGSSC